MQKEEVFSLPNHHSFFELLDRLVQSRKFWAVTGHALADFGDQLGGNDFELVLAIASTALLSAARAS